MSQLGPFVVALLLAAIKIHCVVAKSVYYVRIPRAEEPQHAFNNLMTAQMYDYEYVAPSSIPTPLKLIELRDRANPDEQESYQFMEAPVSLSNPIVNVVSKMLRWARDLNRSPTDEEMY